MAWLIQVLRRQFAFRAAAWVQRQRSRSAWSELQAEFLDALGSDIALAGWANLQRGQTRAVGAEPLMGGGVLITGSSGFIGGSVLSALAASHAPHAFVLAGRSTGPAPAGCTPLALDLTAGDLVVPNGISTVLHLAGEKRDAARMAEVNHHGAVRLVEAAAGSDASSLTTQAVRDGDDWIISGTKSWVTSGTHAGVILCMARTDAPDARKGSRGISTFILTPDLPGFSVGKKEEKLGMRASPTVMLNFDEMRVPGDRLVGAEGMGFIYAMQSLDHGRLGIAAQSIGIATAAAEAARAYAAERRQFDTPIKDFEAVQFKLADMAARITSARALLHATARAKDAGQPITQYGAMCKLLASETAMWTTTNAIQVFGGYGYVSDYPVERLFRDAKVTEIYEGTSEVQRIVIARELYPRS